MDFCPSSPSGNCTQNILSEKQIVSVALYIIQNYFAYIQGDHKKLCLLNCLLRSQIAIFRHCPGRFSAFFCHSWAFFALFLRFEVIFGHLVEFSETFWSYVSDFRWVLVISGIFQSISGHFGVISGEFWSFPCYFRGISVIFANFRLFSGTFGLYLGRFWPFWPVLSVFWSFSGDLKGILVIFIQF